MYGVNLRTATTVIWCGDVTLLKVHEKFDKWLPVGGQIEPGETSDEAALREVLEESGLEIELWNPRPALPHTSVTQLVQPVRLLLYRYPSKVIEDCIYYGRSKTRDLAPRKGEVAHLRWFTTAELVDERPYGAIMPRNVRELCLEAQRLMDPFSPSLGRGGT